MIGLAPIPSEWPSFDYVTMAFEIQNGGQIEIAQLGYFTGLATPIYGF